MIVAFIAFIVDSFHFLINVIDWLFSSTNVWTSRSFYALETIVDLVSCTAFFLHSSVNVIDWSISLSNVWSFRSREAKNVDIHELSLSWFALINVDFSIMNVNTLSIWRRRNVFFFMILVTSSTMNNSFMIRKHVTLIRFFNRKKIIFLHIITFMMITNAWFFCIKFIVLIWIFIIKSSIKNKFLMICRYIFIWIWLKIKITNSIDFMIFFLIKSIVNLKEWISCFQSHLSFNIELLTTSQNVSIILDDEITTFASNKRIRFDSNRWL
jgi:hypothetical protein